ncbi:vanin-like protein 2 [Pieris brassicae]|uniref:vanin-like protein 2 n=1 Tax=Pieris brassicae TaxID=7116 RepID=UPI001E65F8F5|nr:vanin-like protein 2 [Pieris brassicae]
MRFTFLILTSLIPLSLQKSTPEDLSYVAAVVEYEFSWDVPTNVQNYLTLIRDAAAKDADVVVFPELCLNPGQDHYVPIPFNGLLKDDPIPAIRPYLYHEILVAISSAARENAIYVVVNIQETMNCEDAPGEECPEKKTYIFNANIVFDRQGAVISRYRKMNLFGEYTRTPALKPDLGEFSTDFGVRFGHFICFDLMFQVPAVQTPQKLNVTDIIYTGMWVSELPYLTAVQIQEAYAYSMNVNFIASGANNVTEGGAGSGIYSGKAGALISFMPGLPTTRLLVTRVPKVPGQVQSYPGPIYNDPSDLDNLLINGDPSMAAHTSRLLVPGYQSFTLTSGDIMCSFDIKLTQTDKTLYKYRAGVLSGVRTYDGKASGGIKVCAVFACTGDGIDSCSKRFPKYTAESLATFEELTIAANLTTPKRNEDLQADNIVYYPISLQPSILPLEPKDYSLNINQIGDRTFYNYKLLNGNVELYSFGIFGRMFERDDEVPSPPWTEMEN